jgi:hypothetical protein
MTRGAVDDDAIDAIDDDAIDGGARAGGDIH